MQVITTSSRATTVDSRRLRAMRLVVSLIVVALALAAFAVTSAHALPPEGGDYNWDGEPTAPAPTPTPTPTLSDTDDEHTTSPTFKSCHGMYTEATLFRSLNKMTAKTDIWSHCWLGGFTGKAVVILADANNRTINADQRSYGVNGMFEASIGFGPNEQHDLVWDKSFPAEEVQLAKGIYITHTYDPNNRLAEILAEAVRIAKPVAELVATIVQMVEPKAG
jgi:hypothetical protein